MAPEVLFRRGRADDASAAAPLVYASGPAAFDYVFGARALELLRTSFERDEGIFGCTNHEVGVIDRRVVAVGAFYDASMLRRRAAGTARAIARLYGFGAAGVLVRALAVEALMPPPAEGELYVAHLGVDPPRRGQGVMTRMLERHVELARRRGYAAVTLDVARTNPGAHRLYERLGFRVVELRRSIAGEGAARVPDHHRMALELR